MTDVPRKCRRCDAPAVTKLYCEVHQAEHRSSTKQREIRAAELLAACTHGKRKKKRACCLCVRARKIADGECVYAHCRRPAIHTVLCERHRVARNKRVSELAQNKRGPRTQGEPTIREKILVAMAEVVKERGNSVSGGDLVERAAKLYPATFMMRGVSSGAVFPDSDRVFTKLTGANGLMALGWIERIGDKVYAITEAGKAKIRALNPAVAKDVKSP